MNVVFNKDMKKLMTDFARGKITKEIYWAEMLNFHNILLSYPEFIKEKNIEAIEIRNNGLIVTLLNGLRFIWDPQDIRTPISVVVNNGDYEKNELNFIKKIIKPISPVIFDRGANIGYYSLHFAKWVVKYGAVIYSFEPIPKTFNILNKNIELNNLYNINTYNIAFGKQKDAVKFYVPKCSGSVAASMRALYETENEIIKCRVERFDDFVIEHHIKKIDFIKCDVEGAELFVIEGGMNSLDLFRPIIFIEMLRKWSNKFDYHPNEIIDIMKNIGYSCFCERNSKLDRVVEITDSCVETEFFFLHTRKHKDIINEFMNNYNT